MSHSRREQAMKIIRGSYDLHTHPFPSHAPRCLDDFELVREADALGMAGVMIKNHYEPTGARAAIANHVLSDCKTVAYGGIALNWPVGGLNPYAVESALRMGAKMIWMPTRDSANCLTYGDMPGDFFSRPGITIFDGQGRLKSCVHDIISLAIHYDAALSTAHLSVEESLELCREGRKRGARMVLTHPEWQRTVIPLNLQRELADAGVLIEKCWLNIAENDCTAEYLANTIRVIGAEHIYLTTDCGKAGFPRPATGMLRFIEILLEQGIHERELQIMLRDNPEVLVAAGG